MANKIYIGTSGFSYPEWRQEGGFYHQVKSKDELKHYASKFNFVEINGSFYREPSVETFLKWKASVPQDFKFTLKIPKYFTHMKRLKVDVEFVERWYLFWEKCLLLEEKLGALLFQLPVLRLTYPKLKDMIKNLVLLYEILPKDQKIVFECRDKIWDCEEIRALFNNYSWSFCIIHVNNSTHWMSDLESGFFPNLEDLWNSAKWGSYFRLHGSEGQYYGSYSKEILDKICQWIATKLEKNQEVFIAFNNTNEKNGFPSALKDALTIQKMLN